MDLAGANKHQPFQRQHRGPVTVPSGFRHRPTEIASSLAAQNSTRSSLLRRRGLRANRRNICRSAIFDLPVTQHAKRNTVLTASPRFLTFCLRSPPSISAFNRPGTRGRTRLRGKTVVVLPQAQDSAGFAFAQSDLPGLLVPASKHPCCHGAFLHFDGLQQGTRTAQASSTIPSSPATALSHLQDCKGR